MCLSYFRKSSRGIIFLMILQSCTHSGLAQSGYWQQHVKYTMDIDMNVVNNQFTGRQQLDYTNHSPDTLKIFFTICT